MRQGLGQLNHPHGAVVAPVMTGDGVEVFCLGLAVGDVFGSAKLVDVPIGIKVHGKFYPTRGYDLLHLPLQLKRQVMTSNVHRLMAK